MSRTLDYSFNLIKKIPADIIDTLSSLKTIYLIQNKISRIAGLDSLAPTLNSLELGGNRIRVSQLHPPSAVFVPLASFADCTDRDRP